MTASLVGHAIFYASLGWPVIPLHNIGPDGDCSCDPKGPWRDDGVCRSAGKHPRTPNGLKDASSATSVVQEWWSSWPDANIGIRTGVRFDVIDLDGEDGIAWFAEQEAQHGAFPDGLRAKSGRGGRHILIQPTGSGNKAHMDGRKVDFRGQDGYIIVAPSKTVGTYEWMIDGPLSAPIPPIPEAPDWVKEMLTEKKRVVTDSAGTIPKGARNDTLTSMAGWMRGKGLERDAIAAALHAINETAMEEPVGGREVEAVATSATRWNPNADYINSDAGFAEWFIDSSGVEALVRFDHSIGKWYIFGDHRWRKDTRNAITQKWIASARGRAAWAAGLPDKQDREREGAAAKRMESTEQRIKAGLQIASTFPGVATDGEDWDTNPYLLGCENGVVDLRTGILREGAPDDLITMTTGIVFDPEAKAPRFDRFLREVFDGDEELIEWVQRAVGYSATGMTNEEVLFVLHGAGANGKSRLLGAISDALGDYAYTSEMKTFEAQRDQGISNDIMALKGRRFVVASEARAGTVWNEQRLKMLTGSEKVTARALYREATSFRPVCALWFGVNAKPEVRDSSDGLWRRLLLIPFTVRFDTSGDPRIKGPKADPRLEEALRAELPGILNWIVEGAVKWVTTGLKPLPTAITKATNEYRADEDYLTGFIADCIDLDGDEKVRASDVYSSFARWWTNEGNRQSDILTGAKFGQTFSDRMRGLCPNFDRGHDYKGKFYTGFAMIRPEETAASPSDRDDLGLAV